MYELIYPDQVTTIYATLGWSGPDSTPPLGEIRRASRGTQLYKFVHNLGVAALVVGQACAYDYTNAKHYEINKAGTGISGISAVCGVAVSAIPAGQYGWVQTKGSGSALVDGTADIAAGESLKAVSGQTYWVHDAAITAAPAQRTYCRALAAYTTDATQTLIPVIICCDGE